VTSAQGLAIADKRLATGQVGFVSILLQKSVAVGGEQ
jgi:hypothetical protein